jgi:hypothetical protein
MRSKVTGFVCLIENTKEYGKNDFRKRKVILMQNQGKYDNYIPVEFIQDMCDEADQLEMGMEVTIEYSLNGRKWTNPEGEDHFFLSLEVKDFEIAKMAHAVEATQDDEEKEDVPF